MGVVFCLPGLVGAHGPMSVQVLNDIQQVLCHTGICEDFHLQTRKRQARKGSQYSLAKPCDTQIRL